VKDKLMSRMATAYSLQKMRKALSDLRNHVAAQKAQRTQKEAHNNFTSNFRENSNGNANPSINSGTSSAKIDEKRNGINNNIEESECEYHIRVKNRKRLHKLILKYSRIRELPLLNFFLMKTCAVFNY